MRALVVVVLALGVAAPARAQTSLEPASPAATAAEPDEEIRPGPPSFRGPQLRLGFHVSAGALLHDPRWGGFGGLDVIAGARVAKEWSVFARIDVAAGGWAAQGPRFFNAAGASLGVEHIAFRAFGTGTALAVAIEGGVWLPDECRGGACLFLAPMLDVSAAYLTNMNREPANPLAAWSIGLSGGLGVDVAHEQLAGRVVLFVGHDVSL